MEAPLGFFETLGKAKLIGPYVGLGFERAQFFFVLGKVEVQSESATRRRDGWLSSHVILVFELLPLFVVSYPNIGLHLVKGSLSQKLNCRRVKWARILQIAVKCCWNLVLFCFIFGGFGSLSSLLSASECCFRFIYLLMPAHAAGIE